MISRLNKHCGYCVPCISRRIAIEYNGLSFKEYEIDIFKADISKLGETDDRRRNLTDYLEFVTNFQDVSEINKQNLLDNFPELYNPSFNQTNAIDLYNRVSKQSFLVFKNYPFQIKN